jgi:hypothetical protein
MPSQPVTTIGVKDNKMSQDKKCKYCIFWFVFGPWKNRNYRYCIRDREAIKHHYQIGETEFQSKLKELCPVCPDTGWCPLFQKRP